MADSKQAFGDRRSDHHHHIYDLGEDTLKPIREFVAAYKKQAASHSRIEMKLDEVLAALSIIQADGDMAAAARAVKPVIDNVVAALDKATPDSHA